MKQIVPFKKELPFKTKVSEITSISLEREINVEEEGIITGVFHITGNYKMNEGSINRDEFSFDLPFDITLDPRYDISTVKADIDDFYYDIINNDTLSVNIDLFIEAEYLSEDITKKEDTLEEEIENEEIEEVRVEDNDVKEDIQVLDENPSKKTTTGTVIGDNVYYTKYTTQVMDELSTSKRIQLKEGDIISVKVENTNTTIAHQLRNFVYKVTGNSSSTITAEASGMVTTTGTTK